jgi:hypothetical protein
MSRSAALLAIGLLLLAGAAVAQTLSPNMLRGLGGGGGGSGGAGVYDTDDAGTNYDTDDAGTTYNAN